MFLYQPAFNNINIKHEDNEYNVPAWKSKGIYIFELRMLHDLAAIILCYGHKIILRFCNGVLTITQSNYKTKIVNVCISYDLDVWPKT